MVSVFQISSFSGSKSQFLLRFFVQKINALRLNAIF